MIEVLSAWLEDDELVVRATSSEELEELRLVHEMLTGRLALLGFTNVRQDGILVRGRKPEWACAGAALLALGLPPLPDVGGLTDLVYAEAANGEAARVEGRLRGGKAIAFRRRGAEWERDSIRP